MKKLFISLLLLNAISYTSIAQVTQILNAVKPTKAFEGTPALDRKASVFSVGFGIPNNTNTLLSGGGIISSILNAGGSPQKKQGFGPVFVGYEYFLKKELSLGLSFTFANGKQDYGGGGITIPVIGSNLPLPLNGEASINLFQIAATSNYHLYTTDKLDPYIKGAVGINIWKTKFTSYNSSPSDPNPFTAPTPFGYQGIVGLRYFVSKKFALYWEVGYSSLKFTANLGLSVRL